MDKITFLKDNHLSSWLSTRSKVFDLFSSQQAVFCVCGKIASGLHEMSCRKFNKAVDNETAKRLKDLIHP